MERVDAYKNLSSRELEASRWKLRLMDRITISEEADLPYKDSEG